MYRFFLLCYAPEKYLNSSLCFCWIVRYYNLNPECIFEPLGRKLCSEHIKSVLLSAISHQTMLIKHFRVCGSILHVLLFLEGMLTCCRQQTKDSMDKKLLHCYQMIIHELLVSYWYYLTLSWLSCARKLCLYQYLECVTINLSKLKVNLSKLNNSCSLSTILHM